jgi:hypothetical protein
MIVFPDAGYNSFISSSDADAYFITRLHSDDYVTADPDAQEAALITAFRSLMELDITIDPTDLAQVQALENAQCEQALYELKEDLDSQNLAYFALQGIKAAKKELPRHSPRAMAILRPYLKAPVLRVTR